MEPHGEKAGGRRAQGAPGREASRSEAGAGRHEDEHNGPQDREGLPQERMKRRPKQKGRLAAVAALGLVPLVLNPYFIGAAVGTAALLVRRKR